MTIKLSETDLKALLVSIREKGSNANTDDVNAKEIVNEIATFIRKRQNLTTVGE